MLRIPICKISSLASKHFFAMSSINSVKGMKDVVNEDMLKFEHIRRKGIEIFKKHGYQEVQPNILEHEELFQRSLGEASEIIQKEMYRFDDASGRKLVLRPEGTAGVVRMFIEKGMTNTVLPRKFYYCGPMYRYENPQKGRQRQFYQLGVENIGSGDVFADIELLSMADSFMQSIKKKKNYYQIEINTLGDIESRAKYSQALKEYFTREDNYAKLSEISKTRLKLNNALRILDSKEKSDIDLVKDCPKIIDYLTENSKKNYKLIKDSLTRLGIDYNENPNLVRGLDYYTDLCFEIKYKNTEHEETKDTLMGGGRYDLLIGQLKGQKDLKDQVPAIGFGAGMERLMLALEDDDGWKENDKEYKKVGIAFIWDKNAASEVNSDLKLKGIEIPRLFGVEDKIIFEAAYHLNKIDKQMNYFDKKSFDYVVILGPDELKNKKVKVKDMRSGAQSMVDLQENFAEHFRNNFVDNKSA